ncbi:MAG TPA: hypothetical protein VHZ99_11685 [Steroidobacteraceae bacterium]|jgi:hypothetical protein|nr:hypothetical protein [Steroidobacteraceae bacterium]
MQTAIKSLFVASLVAGSLLGAPAMAADIAVVMHAGAAPLTRDQIADLYLGRNTALRPLDLPSGNPARDVFYRRATDRDASQVKAVWSRIIFTGQGQPPKELADDATVKKAVAADPKLVGYIDKSDVDSSVQVVLTLP